MSETIFALSSAPGRAGVAVVRISGERARSALETLGAAAPPPRRAALRTLRTPSGVLLDRALVLIFEAPHSFTGEDVVELHLHGGLAVVAAVLRELGRIDGLAAAGPGAFTRRALEAGKLDLAQAEGLADLIAAETDAQRIQALAQADGALGAAVAGWRARLVRALALLEAEIDFPDEADVPALLASVRPQIAALHGDIAAALADGRRGEITREGLKVAILGAPNAGKSSLLNALAAREIAIVTEIAGTTRDVIEVRLDLGGHAVVLSDTAGLRASADPVETIGIARARAAAGAADLRLLLVDTTAGDVPDIATALLRPGDLMVFNKCDLAPAPPGALAVSAKTGAGIAALAARLSGIAAERAGGAAEPALIARARHRAALEAAAAALARAGVAPGIELAAEDLRLAARAFGRITGAIGVEELLDAVFAEFCIGK